MSRRLAEDIYAQRRKDILEMETPLFKYTTGGLFEIVAASPREYELTMSSLEFQRLFFQIARWSDTTPERVFYPEKDEYLWMKRYNHPMLTLESGTSIKNRDLIIFSISNELEYIRVLQMMKLSNIELRSSKRSDTWPIIIAEGMPVTANPIPLAPFMDAFVIGETEPSVGPVLETIRNFGGQGASKKKILTEISKLPGIYVPSIHKIPGEVTNIMRQWADSDGLGMVSCMTSPKFAQGNHIQLEISRGCPYNCKFCLPGYVSLPYRECKFEDIESKIAEIPENRKLAIVGFAPHSHPEFRDIIKLAMKKHDVVIASRKAEDSCQQKERIVDMKASTLVLAPETGSDSLRKIIGKNLENADILRAIEKHSEVKQIRLYFMLGLPFETDDDRDDIINLIKEIRSRTDAQMNICINPFVPRPWTAFQWAAIAHPTKQRKWMERLRKKITRIRKARLIPGDPRRAHVQAIIARGDERMSKALEYKLTDIGWNTAFKNADIDISWVCEMIESDTRFLWDFINMGFGHTRLAREFQTSMSAHQSRMRAKERKTSLEEDTTE